MSPRPHPPVFLKPLVLMPPSRPCSASGSPRNTGFATRRVRRLALAFSILATVFLVACTDTGWPDRDPVIVDNPDADSLVFHPPLAYALPGDRLTVAVRGLKTGYACADILAFAGIVTDSGTRTIISVTSQVRRPGTPECPLVPGKDTSFETGAPAAGRTVVLRTPRGAATDSLFVFAGTASVHTFMQAPEDTLNSHDRFTFRDSTTAHPRRVLYTDSLASCEALQSAVFSRRAGSDTLRISYRTLTAAPALPDTILPACSGIHGDTVEVVEDVYGFL